MAKCLLIIAALSLASSACENPKIKEIQTENDELQGQVSALTEKLENTRTAITEVQEYSAKVKTAAEELESETSSFDDENWRDVVPRVRSAGDEVATAQTDLDSSIEELETAASED